MKATNLFKTLALIALALFLFGGVSFISSDTVYCDGWEDGYAEGYCYNEDYGCLAPIAPLCPIPKINRNQYKDGYNRGFKQGLNDGN